MRKSRSLLVAAVAALVLAACGSDDDSGDAGSATDATAAPTTADAGTGTTGTETTDAASATTDAAASTTEMADGEVQSLTVTIPFPSGAVFYPLYVADAEGYFADEGLEVTVEPVDGSGAILQTLLSGQAEIGLPSPGPLLQAVEEGAELQSVYTLFQSNVFALVTMADSGITSLDDLDGETIGVGTLDGGEVPFVKAMLSQEAGLEEGDYNLLAVGDGGTAAVALERGDVAAYAAAFPDVAILKLQGLDVVDLITDDFRAFFDSVVVMEDEFIAENSDVVEGFGRALARATQWGFDNPDQVIDITSQYFPEEGEDRELTQAFLDETIVLFELPAAADGQFGYAVPEAVDSYIAFLVAQGELQGTPTVVVFSNDFVPAYNDS